jgi:hypothetical protein
MHVTVFGSLLQRMVDDAGSLCGSPDARKRFLTPFSVRERSCEMSSPALRVCLDDDVDVLLGRLLDARGFDSLSASRAGNLAWPDQRRLEFAAAEERVLITHNRVDFEELAKQWWKQSRDHGQIQWHNTVTYA